MSRRPRDAAILNARGVPVRDITPDKFQSYFGNGYAAMADYIAKNPDVIEGFGRALVRATRFTMDPKNREKVLKHLAAGNPQEGEDKKFATPLLDAVLAKATPTDQSKGWGYQHPQDWENWHKALLATGDLKQPLPDIEAAYTNKFVEAWNKTQMSAAVTALAPAALEARPVYELRGVSKTLRAPQRARPRPGRPDPARGRASPR